MNFTEEEKEFFMKEALKEAQKAAENEEVPIGVISIGESLMVGRHIMLKFVRLKRQIRQWEIGDFLIAPSLLPLNLVSCVPEQLG